MLRSVSTSSSKRQCSALHEYLLLGFRYRHRDPVPISSHNRPHSNAPQIHRLSAAQLCVVQQPNHGWVVLTHGYHHAAAHDMVAPVPCEKLSHVHDTVLEQSQQPYLHGTQDMAGYEAHGVHDMAGYEASLQQLSKDGQLERALSVLQSMPFSPSASTYLALLKLCLEKKALHQVEQIHEHLMEHKVELSGFLGDYLVVTLANCGAFDIANQVSCTLPRLTVFSSTALISAYVKSGHFKDALAVYERMEAEVVEPNTFTFVCLLKACSIIHNLEFGKKLHADARSKGLASDLYVGTALISMYGKCRAVVDAEDVFMALTNSNLVSWNAMLSAYVNDNQGQKALQLYRQMHHNGVAFDHHTVLHAIQACCCFLENEDASPAPQLSTKTLVLDVADGIYADARYTGVVSNPFVATALLGAYAKCGAVAKATAVFESLIHRDTISWNAMVSSYIQLCKADKALQLFKQMQCEGTSPDALSYVLALQACGTLAEKGEAFLGTEQLVKEMPLEIGQEVHADALRKGYVADVIAWNTLVSMYGKCGAVMEAEYVFDTMDQRDVISWTAMLSAYLEHDQAEKAFWLYNEMQKEGVVVDDITMICILQVCSESGSLEMCNQLHFDVTSAGYEQAPFMAATLIYAYGSCPCMADAQAVLEDICQANLVPWNTCIAGYATEGDYEAGLHMFEELTMEGVEPDDFTCSSVVAACRHTGGVRHGLGYFESMSRFYGMVPNLKHYASLLDLLGRAGDFRRVQKMLDRMPLSADITIWQCLLGACHAHGNLSLAKQAFSKAVNLQPTLAIPYILMANTYINAGLHECAVEIEKARVQHAAWEKVSPKWMKNEGDGLSHVMWE